LFERSLTPSRLFAPAVDGCINRIALPPVVVIIIFEIHGVSWFHIIGIDTTPSIIISTTCCIPITIHPVTSILNGFTGLFATTEDSRKPRHLYLYVIFFISLVCS